LSPEVLENTLSHFRMLILSAKVEGASEEEPEEHDPLIAQPSWTSVSEPFNASKKGEGGKSLPAPK